MAAKPDTSQTPSEIIVTQDIFIPNGESLSAPDGSPDSLAFVRFKQTTFVGIVMPAAWTAASMTFQASTDDVNFDLFHLRCLICLYFAGIDHQKNPVLSCHLKFQY